MENDQIFDNLLDKTDKTKQFVDKIGLVECKFLKTHIRGKKLMPGEIAPDEKITNLNERFKIKVFFVVLDQINTSIMNRFQGARDILSNLLLLTFDRLKVTSEGAEISEDNFISDKIGFLI